MDSIGALAGSIGHRRETFALGKVREHAAGVQDHSRALAGDPITQDFAADEEGSRGMDIHHLLPCGRGTFVQGAIAQGTGASPGHIENGVDRAQLLNACRDCFLDCAFIGDVGGEPGAAGQLGG
jgi:hypothetical protein